MIPIEDRKYVLRYRHGISPSGRSSYVYYSNQYSVVVDRLIDAKLFNFREAKYERQNHAFTGGCEIKRVTDKMLFKAALEGR